MDPRLKMSEALQELSLQAHRESNNWEPVPGGETFSFQAMSTDAHKKLVRQFLRDYYHEIQDWGAGCEIIRRGPYLLKQGGRARASGMIIPLLEDHSVLSAADKQHQEPIVKLVKPPPSKFEKDVSSGWQGYFFPSDQGNRIVVEKGSIMFILLHAVARAAEDAEKQPKKATEDTMEGQSANNGEGARES